MGLEPAAYCLAVLGADAAAVRAGHHEPGMDRRPRRLRSSSRGGPKAEWTSRATGVLLAGWGVWAIVTAAM